jgi:hypothetical protein
MFYRRHRRVSLQTPHACVRVTSIPVAPPRAASIEPPELRRAAPLPPTRDQGWGNSRPLAPADRRAERQRRSRRVFAPSAPFDRPWTFARKPAKRGSKCVAATGRPLSAHASHAKREAYAVVSAGGGIGV